MCRRFFHEEKTFFKNNIDNTCKHVYDVNVVKKGDSVKKSELLKILKRSNCSFIREGKRHEVWYSENTEKQFAVPRHASEIKKGTAESILKEAGLK